MKENNAFLGHFMTMIAALASFTTLISFLVGNINDLSYSYEFRLAIAYVLALFIFFISWAYAYYQTRTKTKITINIQDSLMVTVEEGDIFKKKGIICIPFNNFFDTDIENLIDPNSLPGRLIKNVWKGKQLDLHSAIEKSLNEQNIKGLTNCKRAKSTAYTTSYPLGTCALIEKDDNLYCLISQTRYDENDELSIERSEFNDVVGQLLQFLAKHAGTKTVYMPILGSGITPLKRSPQRILNNILSIIDFEYPIHLEGGLHIVSSNLSNKNIDLNKIEMHFNDLE